MPPASIRPYEADDLSAVYDVCLLTGAAGADWTPMVCDPMLPGHLYAAPYVVLQPDLALVVDDAEGVGGYILGTDDSATFERRLEAEWFPALRGRYPEGSGVGDVDRRLIGVIHHPDHADLATVATYPAHFHIDLVPRLQGGGLGRELIERFVAELVRRDVPGVHLGVSLANRNALDFYAHLGFETLRAGEHNAILGRRLGAPSIVTR